LLLLGPILLPVGALFFVALILELFGAPVCAVYLIANGRYMLGPLLIVLWLLLWKRSWKLFGRCLQGCRWASL
jgi:hypothetical protein